LTLSGLHELGAGELGRAYRQRQLSPVEVARAVLRHIGRWEPTCMPPGRSTARRRWCRPKRRRRAGCGRGDRCPLDGVPTLIKENIATRVVPLPLGTAATELLPAAQDAPPAARLREAGAVILGKTTMPDYGMLSSGLSSFHALHALTRNPWDLTKNPGGSSAGQPRPAAPPPMARCTWAPTSAAPCACLRPGAAWSPSNPASAASRSTRPTPAAWPGR
jgi:aspartyl-tRNA(Asn)/glutamyl-tRNA(Gln) amidotransferase subunit A